MLSPRLMPVASHKVSRRIGFHSSLVSHHHHLRLSLFRFLRPGTAAASPSHLLRHVDRPFSAAGSGLHTKGGPVLWEAQQGA